MASSTIQPFERWGIDFIGQLPKTPSGNQWIITAIDYATGWPIAKALPDSKAWRVAEFIYEEIVVNFGAPGGDSSDNGANFLAEVARTSSSDGQYQASIGNGVSPKDEWKGRSLERYHRSNVDRMMVGKSTRMWDQYLSHALFACRVRKSTSTGQSPFYLTYGIEPRLPTDELEPRIFDGNIEDAATRLPHLKLQRHKANQAVLNRAVRAKLIHDKKVRLHKLDIGDWVLVRTPESAEVRS